MARETIHSAQLVVLLELFLLLQRLLLSLKHDVILEIQSVDLQHAEQRVLSILVLSHEHFLLVFYLMKIVSLLGSLLG